MGLVVGVDRVGKNSLCSGNLKVILFGMEGLIKGEIIANV